jgi:ATP-dependent Clp protease ATP-binding subunit ClpA
MKNNMIEEMKTLVIGQDSMIEAVIPYVKTFQAGLTMPGRPIGCFFLAGPTGTGKTHSVGKLAELIHGSEQNILRIDCGEFQLEHEVAKLIGAPPGYLGHRETAPMISQSKLNAAASERSPISILLFDEIEKAADSMKQILLGVLDRAQLKLGDNTVVNFERTLIFMTSNVGAENIREILTKRTIGFGSGPNKAKGTKKAINEAMKEHFSPEFINRIDEIIPFNSLTQDNILKIVDIELSKYINFFGSSAPRFELSVSDAAKKFIAKSGFSEEFGARSLKRFLQKEVYQKVTDIVVDADADAFGTIEVSKNRGGLAFNFVQKETNKPVVKKKGAAK